MATSAEVLQEFLHADVGAARALVGQHPALSARGPLHLATCRRQGATDVLSYDRSFVAAFRA